MSAGAERDPHGYLRSRLEAFRQRRQAGMDVCESIAAVMPDHLGAVLRAVDPPAFIGAQADYVVLEASVPLEAAWPAKRIGIRVTSWPRVGSRHSAPDSFHNDTALRERGWLILPVDPDAANSVEQLERALRVVRRMGAYRR